MSPKPIRCVDLSPTLHLHVYAAHTGYAYKAGHRLKSTGESMASEGFWLYDDARGMNLAMRAASERDALVEAISYYQERLALVESQHAELSKKVDAFVAQFASDDGKVYAS